MTSNPKGSKSPPSSPPFDVIQRGYPDFAALLYFSFLFFISQIFVNSVHFYLYIICYPPCDYTYGGGKQSTTTSRDEPRDNRFEPHRHFNIPR